MFTFPVFSLSGWTPSIALSLLILFSVSAILLLSPPSGASTSHILFLSSKILMWFFSNSICFSSETCDLRCSSLGEDSRGSCVKSLTWSFHHFQFRSGVCLMSSPLSGILTFWFSVYVMIWGDVVGRTLVPQSVPVRIPGACEYVTLLGKRALQVGLKALTSGFPAELNSTEAGGGGASCQPTCTCSSNLVHTGTLDPPAKRLLSKTQGPGGTSTWRDRRAEGRRPDRQAPRDEARGHWGNGLLWKGQLRG